MSRLPRLAVGGHPHLILQRGLSSQPLFADDADRRLFVERLFAAAAGAAVALHAYVLLDAEVQLLATPADASGLGRMMQSLGRSYVAAFNRRHGRLGTLWQGRFRAAPIEAAEWLVAAMRFVESAPVRAGFPNAIDYEWSSAAHHVGRSARPGLTAHSAYWQLGNTPFDREARYRTLLERALTGTEISRLGDAAEKGWALGTEQFLHGLAALTERRLRPRTRGRPETRVKSVPV